MTLVKLTKVNYTGEAYYNIFKKIDTGEEVIFPCTKEEYEALGRSEWFPPEREGYEFTNLSAGGAIGVDTPDFVIKEGEYCEYEDGYYVVTMAQSGRMFGGKVPLDSIVNDEMEQPLI